MNEKIKMRDGDAILAMVKDGKLLHRSWNMALPHGEFVRHQTGTLPSGASVAEVMGITCEYFMTSDSPALPEVNAAIKDLFV